MANALLQSIHSSLLAPSEALVPAQGQTWELANNFYALYAKEGRKAIFRSKSVSPEFAGQVVTVSLMTRENEEYLTLAIHDLGNNDSEFTSVGFASINTPEAFQETGIFAGGRLLKDSPLREHGFERHQLIVTDGVMSLVLS